MRHAFAYCARSVGVASLLQEGADAEFRTQYATHVMFLFNFLTLRLNLRLVTQRIAHVQVVNGRGVEDDGDATQHATHLQ